MGSTEQSPGGHCHPDPQLPHVCLCRNNGVLFENQLLQIGVKSEFRQNLGWVLGAMREASRRPWLGEDMKEPMEPCLPHLLPQAECISSMATRPRCSLRIFFPLSTLGPPDSYPLGLAQPCPPGLPSWQPGNRSRSCLAPLLESLSPWYFSLI